jgi:hypothetical protein
MKKLSDYLLKVRDYPLKQTPSPYRRCMQRLYNRREAIFDEVNSASKKDLAILPAFFSFEGKPLPLHFIFELNA